MGKDKLTLAQARTASGWYFDLEHRERRQTLPESIYFSVAAGHYRARSLGFPLPLQMKFR